MSTKSDINKVLVNSKVKIDKIKNSLRKGLIKAGLFIQAESQRRTPVKFGNLKASAFTVWDRGGQIDSRFNDDDGTKNELEGHHAIAISEATGMVKNSKETEVVVGHSTWYAKIQHYGKFNHKVGESHYLENAVKNNEAQIMSIIKSSVKV